MEIEEGGCCVLSVVGDRFGLLLLRYGGVCGVCRLY